MRGTVSVISTSRAGSTGGGWHDLTLLILALRILLPLLASRSLSYSFCLSRFRSCPNSSSFARSSFRYACHSLNATLTTGGCTGGAVGGGDGSRARG